MSRVLSEDANFAQVLVGRRNIKTRGAKPVCYPIADKTVVFPHPDAHVSLHFYGVRL